jgi:hypothetical protein
MIANGVKLNGANYSAAATDAQCMEGLMEIEVDDTFLKYDPGSRGAVERGCTCPQAENNFGQGRSKNGVIEPHFASDPCCPIHGLEALLGIKIG